ncbi:MAG: hypothetical protein RL885_05945 [Planctomycetota bacterium]
MSSTDTSWSTLLAGIPLIVGIVIFFLNRRRELGADFKAQAGRDLVWLWSITCLVLWLASLLLQLPLIRVHTPGSVVAIAILNGVVCMLLWAPVTLVGLGLIILSKIQMMSDEDAPVSSTRLERKIERRRERRERAREA